MSAAARVSSVVLATSSMMITYELIYHTVNRRGGHIMTPAVFRRPQTTRRCSAQREACSTRIQPPARVCTMIKAACRRQGIVVWYHEYVNACRLQLGKYTVRQNRSPGGARFHRHSATWRQRAVHMCGRCRRWERGGGWGRVLAQVG